MPIKTFHKHHSLDPFIVLIGYPSFRHIERDIDVILQYTITPGATSDEIVSAGNECFKVMRARLTIDWTATIHVHEVVTEYSTAGKVVYVIGGYVGAVGAAGAAVGGAVAGYGVAAAVATAGWGSVPSAPAVVSGGVIATVSSALWGFGNFVQWQVPKNETVNDYMTYKSGTAQCQEVTIDPVECPEGTMNRGKLPFPHSADDCLEDIINSLNVGSTP